MATLASDLAPVRKARGVKRSRAGFSRVNVERARELLGVTASKLYSADIVVDLGDSIGTPRWWRGLATVVLLTGSALSLGYTTYPLLAPARDALTPEQSTEARYDRLNALARGSDTGRQVAPGPVAKRLNKVPERPRLEVKANVGSGGLEGALRRSGVGRDDLALVRQMLNAVGGARGVASGTEVEMVLGRRESQSQARPLELLKFRAAFDKRMEVQRNAAGELVSKVIPIKIDHTPLRVRGQVGGSLHKSARAAGVPSEAISDFVRQMSYVVDFQRDVGRRDTFDIIIEHQRAETGETRTGKLLYAGLVNGRSNISLMRWGPKGEFFWQNGEGAKKGMTRTPVDGARMSSGFGMRLHPVLNYSRMHQGIDFAAPRGTPIRASAAGRVTMAGWGGGYGNVVRISHGKGLETRYAHMHKIGVKAGQEVTQGQLIGQVGSTGLSTGPHLHYEMWQNGRAIDPRGAKFVGSNKLGGSDLRRFQGEMARLKGLSSAG